MQSLHNDIFSGQIVKYLNVDFHLDDQSITAKLFFQLAMSEK